MTQVCYSDKRDQECSETVINLKKKFFQNYSLTVFAVVFCWFCGCNKSKKELNLMYINYAIFLKCFLNVHMAYLNIFFIWSRVLKHNKYVISKQFSKIDIKQNNISTIILLIRFLVYQWDPRHLQSSLIVYIFVYIKSPCSA